MVAKRNRGQAKHHFNAFSGSTVNITGGEVGNNFDANNGSEVNISGGTVGEGFDAFSGSTVNITGGELGNDFDASSGSTVNISGGIIGSNFDAFSGSEINISGGEFSLNGTTITDLSSPFTLGNGDIFTGTLEDGSLLVFSTQASDNLSGINLFETFTPVIDTTPQTINTASILRGARSGETLTVQDGGELGDNFTAVGATLNVEAGSVGANVTAFSGSTINISGGTVGSSFNANGSTVNISGGIVSEGFDALDGSTVNISGGIVGDDFKARGGTVNISGGDCWGFLRCRGRKYG